LKKSVGEVKRELENVEQIAEVDLHKLDQIVDIDINDKKEKLSVLRHSVLHAQEILMKNLLELDQLVGSSEKVRPYRKQQVKDIQETLNQVDQIGSTLKKN